MTPTPQSLDTVTEALEAAAKVADGWREIDWPEHVHRSAVAKVAESIASRIRALAIKPTPVGECDGPPLDDAIGKAFNALGHAPAASPVQGVDYQDAFSVCHGALLVIGRGRQEIDQVREYALEVADRIGKQVAEALIDATPQAPSTVDERVSVRELAAMVCEHHDYNNGGPFPNCEDRDIDMERCGCWRTAHIIRTALDAKEK